MFTVLRRRAVLALERARRRLHTDDGGFILLESMIAIALITVIMGAVGAEYVSGMASTDHHRSSTTAVQLADTAIVNVRALHPSDLVTGRSDAAVSTERTALTAIGRVQPWINGSASRQMWDDSGAPAVVPTTPLVQRPGQTSFDVWTFLECTADSTLSADGQQRTCGSTSSSPDFVRAVVAVTWQEQGCPADGCSYTTSTVISADADPEFDINQTLPPAPVVAAPGDQAVAMGDNVNLQLQVQNGKGVAPFTWALTAGSLPDGVTYNPAGTITGTVADTATSTSVTFQVTDAFLRTATTTFAWTVSPRLSFTVGNQANTTADSVSLALTASGGSGSGYTYSDSGATLPPGLTLDPTGTVTGTPTRTGTYPVRLTVTDGTGRRSTTANFTWTIAYPPLALSDPGNQTSTSGQALTALQLVAAGGDNRYTFSASSLPAGLTISAAGKITGTPTATGTSTVTATVTDPTAGAGPTSVTFRWTVVDRPTITTPVAQGTTRGNTVNLAVGYTCPDSPCTFTASGLPNGLSVNSSTGAVVGTVAANANTSTTAKVTVRDAAGATAATGTFTWTIYAAPTLTPAHTAVTTAEGAVPSEAIAYTCAHAPCTLQLAAGNVPGVGLSTSPDVGTANSTATLTLAATSGTVYLTGLVPSSAGGSGSVVYPMKLTLTDADSISAASTPNWTVRTAPSVSWPGDQSYRTGDTPAVAYSVNCPGTCTVSVTGLPSGLGLSSAPQTTAQTSTSTTTMTGNHYLTGRISASAGTYTVVLKITYSSTTVTSTGVWTVS